jgi:hypothetical protein
LGTIYIRYKDADGFEVEEISCPITDRVFHDRFNDASASFRLAAAAAEFAEILRGSAWAQSSSLAAVYGTARDVYREWKSPEVKEFMQLVERADRLREDRAER